MKLQGSGGRYKAQTSKWQRDTASVLRQAKISTLVLEHPETPWLAKFVAGCAVLYVVRPIQVLPACIPVIGQWDDLLVMWIGMKTAPEDDRFRGMRSACQIRSLLKTPRVKSSIHDERGFSDLTRTDRPTVDASLFEVGRIWNQTISKSCVYGY